MVELAGEAAGFFSLERAPSPWWPPDDVPALYLAGMVVGPKFLGWGIGDAILTWCTQQALERGFHAIRLDCHAGNPWLCGYYEAHGFELRRRIEQHPGYEGCLYEARVVNPRLGNPTLSG
jgi:GNAT superfamily N-acetyltransferase